MAEWLKNLQKQGIVVFVILKRVPSLIQVSGPAAELGPLRRPQSSAEIHKGMAEEETRPGRGNKWSLQRPGVEKAGGMPEEVKGYVLVHLQDGTLGPLPPGGIHTDSRPVLCGQRNTVDVAVCDFQGWIIRDIAAFALVSWVICPEGSQVPCHEDV